MAKENNSFSDKNLGIDYDGKVLTHLGENGEEIVNQEMDRVEAHNYYQALRRGLGREQAELVDDKLQKLCKALEKKLNSLPVLKGYGLRFSAVNGTSPENYDRNEEIIRIHGSTWHPGFGNDIELKVIDGKFQILETLEQVTNDSESLRLLKNRGTVSLNELASILEAKIRHDEKRLQQAAFKGVINNLLLNNPGINSRLKTTFEYPGLARLEIKDSYENYYNPDTTIWFEMYPYPDGSLAVRVSDRMGDKHELNMEDADSWHKLENWLLTTTRELLDKSHDELLPSRPDKR